MMNDGFVIGKLGFLICFELVLNGCFARDSNLEFNNFQNTKMAE